MNTIKSPRIMRFIEEASKPSCRDATEAALAAGYAPSAAWETARRLTSDPVVVAAVQARITKRAEAVDITPQLVLQHWLAVATADPAALIRTRKLNCRYCFGIGHAYQFANWEYAEEAAQRMDQGESLKGMEGGPGFKFNADPNPDCPRCMGEGITDVYIADTSTVPEKDRVLYAGLKQTKDGIEIKMHDQQAAWDNIRDYLGMVIKRGELTGKNGQPLYPPGAKLPDVVDVLPNDPKLLEAAYREITSL